MSHPAVAAIIPAYNEEKTVASVVKALVKSPLITEVIVISDGSSDGTAEAARNAGATLVHELPRKSGKGAAVQHGITHTDAPIVFLCDADLYGLTPDHVRRIVEPVLSGELSMCVGLRDRGKFMMKVMAHMPLIGGERAFHRRFLEQIPERFLQGFMLEAALNYAHRRKGLAYGTAELPGLKIRRKMQKVGVWKGLLQYIKMFVQVGWTILLVRIAALRGQF